MREERLYLALALSVCIHALVFYKPDMHTDKVVKEAPSNRVLAQVQLSIPELKIKPPELLEPVVETQAHLKTTPKIESKRGSVRSSSDWTQAVKKQFKKQQAEGKFYPLDAINQGIEGIVQVLIVLDASGNVTASRIEQPSGFPILDNAALRAVKSLHTLPSDTPREVVIPVSFRLH